MQLAPDKFADQFEPTIQVCVMPAWRLRSKAFPQLIPSYVYRYLTECNGRFSLELNDFCARIEPELIQYWHGFDRKNRPSAAEFTSWLYRVCSALEIEVTIGPPTEAHGHRVHRQPVTDVTS